MKKIESTIYGFKITASGITEPEEMEQLKFEIIHTLAEHNRPFSLIIDIRDLVPLSPELVEIVKEIQISCRKMSLERAAIVVKSPVLIQQAAQIGFESITSKYDRIIDASKNSDWEEVAFAWAANAVEPVNSTVEEQTRV
ncbi:MAG: hypothetical protein JXA92_07305 [candidate division Zixibacteria bacterium]|nr:hypothetical protein [candidate division Zixibacteria bacterium]